MTDTPKGSWTRTSRIIGVPPERLDDAFLDPDVLAEWLPPAEMTGIALVFDGRVGGGTQVTLLSENLPPSLSAEDNDAGARLSLAQLARHYE